MSAIRATGRFTALPDEKTLAATAVALEEHGFSVEVVDDLNAAREAVLARIPVGSSVMTNTSMTLQDTGIADAINRSGLYDSSRSKMRTLGLAPQAQQAKVISGQPDYALGSVHAVRPPTASTAASGRSSRSTRNRRAASTSSSSASRSASKQARPSQIRCLRAHASRTRWHHGGLIPIATRRAHLGSAPGSDDRSPRPPPSSRTRQRRPYTRRTVPDKSEPDGTELDQGGCSRHTWLFRSENGGPVRSHKRSGRPDHGRDQRPGRRAPGGWDRNIAVVAI